MNDEMIVRVMTRGEVDVALEWAAAEGWNPGEHDAECFHAVDPNGFLLGLIHGKPVGCISAAAYDDQFGFIGLYIVKPEYRDKGLGIQLFRAGMKYLGSRNIGLNAVLAQQATFEKSGFKTALRNVRFTGDGDGEDEETPDVVDLDSFPFAEVAAYDQSIFQAPRKRFLAHWLEPPKGAALGIRENGRLAGYGVVRACRHGFKIGPLFADKPALADQLFRALRRHVPESTSLFIDAPDANPEALALAQRHGLTKVFETVRMYTKKSPPIPLAKVFGASSIELG